MVVAGAAVAVMTARFGWTPFAMMPIGAALLLVATGGEGRGPAYTAAYVQATGLVAAALLLAGADRAWHHPLSILHLLGYGGGLYLFLTVMRERRRRAR